MKPTYQTEQLGDSVLPVTLIRDSVVAGRLVAPHWHDFAEILLFRSGTVELRLNAARFTVGTGDAVLLNSMDIHAMTGEATFYVLELDAAFTEETGRTLRQLFPDRDSEKILRRDDADRPGAELLRRLEEHLPAVADAFSSKEPGYALEIRGRIYQLLGALVRYRSARGARTSAPRPDPMPASRIRDMARLEELLRYLKAHYHEPLTSREAAGRLHFNESYFCRFFRRRMGMPFLQYLNAYRCARAEDLIRHSRMPLSDIAQRVGFSGTRQMTDNYRRYMGRSPSEARRQSADG